MLRANNLKGELPEELGYLSELKELDLSDNYLIGNIPSSIGHLQKLTKLNLRNNGFNGTIPTGMYDLSTLEYLNAKDNYLSGSLTNDIGRMKALITLDLSENQFTGTIPDSIIQLNDLKYLTLSDNYLHGSIPTNIGQMTSLLKLVLIDNDLSGTLPASIGQLTALTNLNISHNKISGTIPVEIGNLSNLYELVVSFNDLSGELPSSMRQMNSLRLLAVHQNHLSEIAEDVRNMSFHIVNLSANKFLFEEMEGISGNMFDYILQDTLYSGNTIQFGHKWKTDTLLIPDAHSVNNEYQWYKDGIAIPGAIDSIFVIDTVLPNREGRYHAEVTNTRLPGLMLLRDTIRYFVDPKTLPVELIDFKVVEQLGTALVVWTTLSEVNADYYDILRSKDGINWQSIGQVKACGTCSEKKQYTLVDPSPVAGVSYYKLVQHDADGQFESFGPVTFGRAKDQRQHSISVYPTICTDKVSVKPKGNLSGMTSIRMISMQGQLIQEWQFEEISATGFDLDLSAPSGTYLLVFTNQHHNEAHRIMVKK